MSTLSTTFLYRTVTRGDILEACKSYDLDPVAFLRCNGFKPSRRFFLRVAGKSYPSKAILGAAAGVPSSRFFGGIRGTVRVLERLGFTVRDANTGRRIDGRLESLRQDCLKAGVDVGAKPWPDLPVEPVAYFASGSNRPSDIRALAAAGADIGVTVSELSENGIQELEALAGTDVAVFVDSGAFSEVKPNDAGELEVVAEITDWTRRLDVYRRLAEALGSQLSIVAPDAVGDQVKTFHRLQHWAEEIGRAHV